MSTVVAGLPPGVEAVDSLFALATGTGILGVHVETERTTVDLDGTNIDELQEVAFEVVFADVPLKLSEDRGRRMCSLIVDETFLQCLHDSISYCAWW